MERRRRRLAGRECLARLGPPPLSRPSLAVLQPCAAAAAAASCMPGLLPLFDRRSRAS